MTIEQRLDRLEQQLETLAESQLQMSNRVGEFVFQSQRLFTRLGDRGESHEARIERLEAITQRLDRGYEEQRSLNQEFRTTTNAALERIDRILDYLMREDRGQ